MLQLAALAMMSASAGASAVGSIYSARSARRNLEHQAAIAEQNARLSEVSARNELMRGDRAVGASRLRTAGVAGAQRAAQAANGVALGEGSAAELAASTEYMGEMDAETIKQNAVWSAWGYRTQGTAQRNEAEMARGTAAGIDPAMAGMTSLLGSAGQVASSWYRMDRGVGMARTRD